MKAWIEKHGWLLLITLFMGVVLSSCGTKGDEEVREKSFGIDYSEELTIQLPEQVICGEEKIWVITTVINDFIYQFDYDTGTAGMEKITWQPEEGTYLIVNIAEQKGALYAELLNTEENILEIRKRGANCEWSKVMTIKAEDEEWCIVGSGFYMDSSENAYLVSGDTVTCFGMKGEQTGICKLGGNACFFQENEDGYVECVAKGADGITLYELKEGKAEEKWSFALSAGQVHGIRSSEEGMLCLATNEELLFFDVESGSLLARSDLVRMGVVSALAGNYDVQEETLWLYGSGKNSTDRLSCSLLSGRDASTEQRTELVYGMVGENSGTGSSIWSAIMTFNQENEDYYITIRNYDGWSNIDRLQADMACGNAPDIIDMTYSDYYESYVKNGYLENLYPYLEQSEYKDDILWNVLEAYEIDGGLYLFVPQFQLSGVLIHPDYEACVEEWNMETFLDLVEKNQWEKNLFGTQPGNPQTLLYYMLCSRQEEFIDWEQKTASFESEEFLKLLALCREYGEMDWSDTSEWTYEEHARNTLCMPKVFGGFTSYLPDVYTYGRGYHIYGYPTPSGQNYEVRVCADTCAIYAGSTKKEGAWQFIESLLSEENQNYPGIVNPGFPIRKSVLEEKKAEAEDETMKVGNDLLTMTEEEFLIVENIIYNEELSNALVDAKIWAMIEEETASYFAGDKSAQEVARIIQSRVEIYLEE